MGLVFMINCSGGSTCFGAKPPEDDGNEMLVEKTKVFDVRTAEEYSDGHAEGAELLPVTDLQAGKLPDLDKDAPIAVYCRSGNRSAAAKQILEAAGFTNVKDYGGIDNLQKYDLKLVQ